MRSLSWLNAAWLAVLFFGLGQLPAAVLAQQVVPQVAPGAQEAETVAAEPTVPAAGPSLGELAERVRSALAAAEAALASEEARLDELAARNGRRTLPDGRPSGAQAAANTRLWGQLIRELEGDRRELRDALRGVLASVDPHVTELARRLSVQRGQAEARSEERAETEKAARDGQPAAQHQAEPEAVERGDAEGEYAVGRVFRDCPACPDMIVVPPGHFDMGSPDSEAGRDNDEGPVHQVTVGYRFAVGVHEVTRGEFGRFVSATNRVMGNKCATWRNDRWWDESGTNWRHPGFSQTDEHPVVCVSWNDAKAYARWLSRETGQRYRLLSESEWEYVARAGASGTRYWDDSQADQCRYVNGADAGTDFRRRAACQDGYAQTAPVGSFTPNGFGLHDVLGNVGEWVEDCWNASYSGAPSNGRAWRRGDCKLRVVRGGSWAYEPQGLRLANRYGDAAGRRGKVYGFRVARTLTR